MSKSNRSAREELERIYGKHCFIHEGIRKLNPPKPHKGTYKGKSIASQLTYHHLRAKRHRRKCDSRKWGGSMQKLPRLVRTIK